MSAGPSTHRLSLLTTRNGSASIIGAAFTMPPPVSSNNSRSSEIVTLRPCDLAAEMRFDRSGQIMDVDDDVLDAGDAQALEHVIHQRTAGNLDEWLGAGGRKRPHPLAETGSHDHCRLRHFRFETSARSLSARRAAVTPLPSTEPHDSPARHWHRTIRAQAPVPAGRGPVPASPTCAAEIACSAACCPASTGA